MSFFFGFRVFIGIGGPLINVFVRGYFVLCLFCWFWVFIGIREGTPDKRISEDLFCPLFFCWFWVIIGIIGGTPDKRISEGLF